MSNHVYDLVITQFSISLAGLKNVMLKAKAHAEANKFDPNKFLDLKFAPDMLALTKQVQIASDNAKGAAGRLSGKEIPVFADDEKTFDELIARVEKTINYLETFRPENFNDYKSKKISFPWYPGKHLDGATYLNGFAIPNVYFHITTTYDLFRNAGVAIGKADFMGSINWMDD
ncbi:MAG: DUF1993 domain-containing protein [Bacteriovoracaceae bacterium]|nr:DUF1993 domain-containing protein [Bacteriovoracaceae bacterium]